MVLVSIVATTDKGGARSVTPEDLIRLNSVNGGFLNLAMNYRGIKFLTTLAERVGLDESTLRKWLNGTTDEPMLRSFRLIEEFLDVPGPLLLLPGHPPEVDNVSFRSRSRDLDLPRLQALAYCALAGMAGAMLLGTKNLVERAAATEASAWPRAPGSYEALAVALRRKFGLGDQEPVGDIVALAEAHGVLVFFAPLDLGALEPFSATMAGIRVIVLAAAERTFERFRFDVAHELGHFVLHPDGTPGIPGERDASNFGAAFLFPPTITNDYRLRDAVRHRDLDLLVALQEEWGISVDSLLQIAKRRIKAPASAFREKFQLLDTHSPSRGSASGGAAGSPSVLPNAAEAFARARGRAIDRYAIAAGIPGDVIRTLSVRSFADLRALAA